MSYFALLDSDDSVINLITTAEAFNKAYYPGDDYSELTEANYAILINAMADYKVTSNAVKAVGLITMAGIAVAEETFIVDTQTFVWKTSRAAQGEVTIGTTKEEAAANIALAINSDITSVAAVDNGNGTVTVTAYHANAAGNTIVFSEASTNMSMNGSGFLGGTTAGVDEILTSKTLLTTVATWNKTTINADEEDSATLGSGLPVTEIIIDIFTAFGAQRVNRLYAYGSFAFKSGVPGIYYVTAKAVGYKDYTVAITASELMVDVLYIDVSQTIKVIEYKTVTKT